MSEKKEAEIVQVRVLTPMQQITLALDKGADLEKLKAILDLQKEWERNEAYKAFNKAMAEFKSEAITINKDKEASFETARGKTEYSYASLSNIIVLTTPSLGRCALAATWRTKQENDRIIVTCRLTHSLGHFEDVTLSAKADTTGSKNEIQAMGSTITYLEKYTYLAALGLATADQDDDAKATTEAPKYINTWQVENLRGFLKQKPWMSEEVFIKHLGVEAIENIQEKDYKKAESAIKSAQKREV